MDANLVLQQALRDISTELLNNQDSMKRNFSHIRKMKKEFGDGYAAINFGFFNLDSKEFSFPQKGEIEIVWLDHETSQEYLKDEIASYVLENIDKDNCPPDHYIFVFVASLDRGEEVKDGRYLIIAEFAYVKDPLTIKPSSITEKQIEKRLRRMHSTEVPLLILDTSNPDLMGKNLAKWLRVLKRFQRMGDKHFNVMINSSSEYPAEIPPGLKDDVCTINFKE
ncbi:MAG: hypothetical protein HC917_25365 [Richelia sp. SM2_1_7]|nr:hypothetical protein [Richelia sp. SM2_1_7]